MTDKQIKSQLLIEKISYIYGNNIDDGLILSTSFGSQSALMLHLITSVLPNIKVVFIDTGYLFKETYKFSDELSKRLNLNLHIYSPSISCARFESLEGRVWENGIEGHKRYNKIFKIDPMEKALKELNVSCWISGIRKEQTKNRDSLKIIEKYSNSIDKIHPILDWTTKDVHEYLVKHNLPYHPLYELGYKSIGDIHSTRRIELGENDRDGRFVNGIQECGLHLPKSNEENNSANSSSL